MTKPQNIKPLGTQNLIPVGISSCLLGNKVRFDSGHKKNSYITSVLADFFDFTSFCPEVSIGLGTPREPIRLIGIDDQIRCVGTKTENLDVTDRLSQQADNDKDQHAELCGYILKKDSPSCGMERVKVYIKGHPRKNGVGMYAQGLLSNFPHLPVEEEGRLEDSRLRENFIQRVYIYSRWKQLEKKGFTVSNLQEFHANHKYIFMSHHQSKARELGAMLARTKVKPEELANQYLECMTELLKIIATRKNHVNTLHHIQGYLKKNLDSDDKQELKSSIEDYQKGLLPLIVPITLLRHHFRRNPNDYITQSYYMQPHPGEMMLLNSL